MIEHRQTVECPLIGVWQNESGFCQSRKSVAITPNTLHNRGRKPGRQSTSGPSVADVDHILPILLQSPKTPCMKEEHSVPRRDTRPSRRSRRRNALQLLTPKTPCVKDDDIEEGNNVAQRNGEPTSRKRRSIKTLACPISWTDLREVRGNTAERREIRSPPAADEEASRP